MARAKSTDRAEARRRHRAIVAAAAVTAAATQDADDEGGEDIPATVAAAATATASKAAAPRTASSTSSAKSASGRSGSKAASDQAAARPSITTAFRGAIRPVDLRSDIAYLPELVLHTRAIWIPSLAILGAGLITMIAPSNQITQLVAQVFVAPPSLAGPFLAGLLAPRATYLAGGIVGIVAALALIIVIGLLPASLFPGPVDRQSIILYALVVSPIFGLAVGGFAGYYRRFLFLSSPNRQRRQASGKSSSKSSAKRR